MSPEQLADSTSLFGRAWLALAAALAIHVADEALTNFLAVYNPTVLKIRARFPWIPLPTFSFRVWIVGLAAAVALMFSLSPVNRKRRSQCQPCATKQRRGIGELLG